MAIGTMVICRDIILWPGGGGEGVCIILFSNQHYFSRSQQTSKERDELSTRVDSMKETINRLEEELRSSTVALTASTTELGKYRTKATQLQGLVDASERTRQEQEQGLRRQAAASHESQASVATANARIGKR